MLAENEKQAQCMRKMQRYLSWTWSYVCTLMTRPWRMKKIFRTKRNKTSAVMEDTTTSLWRAELAAEERPKRKKKNLKPVPKTTRDTHKYLSNGLGNCFKRNYMDFNGSKLCRMMRLVSDYSESQSVSSFEGMLNFTTQLS